MKYKDIKMEFKEIGSEGQFEGYAAAFGNVDLDGDILMPGAFTKTIAENATRPLLWQHNPRELIGVANTSEDTKGLAVKGHLNLDVQRAREVHSLMKQGAVKSMSFGYDPVTKDYRGSNRILREVKMYEVSLTAFPSNTQAVVMNVKSPDDLEELLLAVGRIEFKQELSAEIKSLVDLAHKKLSALQAAVPAPEAATQDDDAPEILHATSDRIQKLLRGELCDGNQGNGSKAGRN